MPFFRNIITPTEETVITSADFDPDRKTKNNKNRQHRKHITKHRICFHKGVAGMAGASCCGGKAI